MERQPKDSPKSNSATQYNVRPGVINFGRDYEYRMIALFSLRCIVEGVEDMWLATNVDGAGAFDDVIIQIRRQGCGTTTFMMQLKHQEIPRNIIQKEFNLLKSDFSLFKYFTDINMLNEAFQTSSSNEFLKDIGNSDELCFVLFTNRGVNDCVFIEKYYGNTLDILSTTDGSKTMYKFLNVILPSGVSCNPKNKHNDFYLLPNQVNFSAIDTKIVGLVQKLVNNHINVEAISKNFVKYVTDWAMGGLGGHYTLSKEDILYKLTELGLGRYELNLSQQPCIPYDLQRKFIWNSIVAKQTITVVNSSDAAITFLLQYIASEVAKYSQQLAPTWGTKLSQKRQKAIYQNNTNIQEYINRTFGSAVNINLLNIYKYAWKVHTLPLLLEIRNVTDYRDILSVLKLSNYSYKVLVINNGNILPARRKGEIKRFETICDLDKESREEILLQQVKIQGRAGALLSDLVYEEIYRFITCVDIINILSDNFNIGNELNQLPEYFVNRSIVKTVLKPTVLSTYKRNLFVIHMHPTKEYAILRHLNECPVEALDDVDLDKPHTIRGILLTKQSITRGQLEKLKLSGKAIHILSVYDDRYFDRKWSWGSIQNIKLFQIDLEIEINTTTVNEYCEPTTIVCAAPGMGKSVLMNYLGCVAPTHKWIMRIDLIRHMAYLRQEHCKTLTTKATEHLEAFYSTISSKDNTKKEFNFAIFKKLLHSQNVIVLLDGYDEVSVSYKQEVTNIALSFQAQQIPIWITTREVMKQHLEETFKTSCVTIKPFTIQDQKNFLIKYFSVRNQDQESLIQVFVNTLLQAARKNLNDRDAEFTGIPLQTKLLADVFTEECRNYIRSNGITNITENFDLIYLYKHFISSKLQIYLGKFGESAVDQTVHFKEYPYLLALKLIFPPELLMRSEEVMKQLHEFCSREGHRIELQKLGIITVDEQLNINCIHRTFAEFLSAEWLSINLATHNQKLRELAHTLIKERFTKNYTFLFNIFDRILAKDFPLHLAIINNDIDKAKDIIKNDSVSVCLADKNLRTALHIMALYGFRYFIKYISSDSRHEDPMNNLISLIPKNILADIGSNTDIIGYMPFDYALCYRSFDVADALFDVTGTLTINTYINLELDKDYLRYTFRFHTQLFDVLLPYFIHRRFLLNDVQETTDIYSYYGLPSSSSYKVKYPLQLLSSKRSLYLKHTLQKSRTYYLNIHHAVILSYIDNIIQLLASGVDINQRNIDQCTPLHCAVAHGRMKVIEILLSNGAKVNHQNADGNSTLHLAILNYNKLVTYMDIVKLLLNKGSNVNIPNKNGDTPVHLASKQGCSIIVQMLVSKGANINMTNNNGETSLHLASEQSFEDVVQFLINEGANINVQNKNGDTPLHLAFYEKNEQMQNHGSSLQQCNINIANLLMSKEANINTTNKNGNTPLYVALHECYFETAELLIENGADVNIANEEGEIPLDKSVFKGTVNIWELLISRGSDVNKVNIDGNTTLYLAAFANNTYIIDLLINRGANVNAKNKQGNTPLHGAAKFNNTDSVQLLIAKGADANIVNKEGQTPLDCAKDLEWTDTVNMLEKVKQKYTV